MANATADHNLHFGMLAVQWNFVSRDALIEAMKAWVLDKTRSFDRLLLDQSTLRAKDHQLLSELVARHLEMHNGDPQKSMQAIQSVTELNSLARLRDDLTKISDKDLGASLTATLNYDRVASQTDNWEAHRGVGDRYGVVRAHAKGGLGLVSVARDNELHREVALKEIQPKHADRPESRARFVLEAEITGRLEHPGIVPVYSLGQFADGRPFYAMRFIGGESLAEAIKHLHAPSQPTGSIRWGPRSMEFRQLLTRFIDVCLAVEYAHSRGILHRDLKPSNVMLGEFGETLVVDWGLAKPFGESGEATDESILVPRSGSGSEPTMVGSAVGTPSYMSPEQASGELSSIGAASDVYCLGATLYQILTGKAPVQGGDVGEVLERVQEGDITRPRDLQPALPPALEAVCLKSLSRNPHDRYASPQELASEIERWMGDEPVHALREPWYSRTARWMRRHQTFVTTTAAVLMVLFAALSILVFREQRANALLRTANERANSRFRLATNAIGQFTTAVDDNLNIQTLPELAELRKQLLNMPREFYRKLRNDLQTSDQVGALERKQLAKSHFFLAQISERIDSQEKALQTYRQATNILDRAAQDDSSDQEIQELLSKCLNNLGNMQRESGQIKPALETLGRSLEIRSRLAAIQPKRKDLRIGKVRTQGNIAMTMSKLGQHSLARDQLAAAIEEISGFARQRPNDRDLELQQARLHVTFGAMQAQLSQDEQALVALNHGLEHYNNAQELNAGPSPAIRGELVKVHMNIAIILRRLSRSADSDASYRSAYDVAKSLVERYSTSHDYRRGFALVCGNWGNLMQDLNRNNEALKLYQQGRRINESLALDNPSNTEYLSDMASSYRNIATMLRKIGGQETVPTHVPLLKIREGDASSLSPVNEVVRQEITVEGADPSDEASLKLLAASLEVRRALVKNFSDVVSFKLELARTHHNLGLLHMGRSRYEEARRALKSAVRIQFEVAREFPKAVDHQLELAQFLVHLGMCRQRTREPLKAEESFADAEQLCHDLPSPQREQANVRRMLAVILDARGMSENPTLAALEAFLQSAQLWQRLHEQVPESDEYRGRLASSFLNAARLAESARKNEVCLDYCQQALPLLKEQIEQSPNRHRPQTQMVELLLLSGFANRNARRFDECVKSMREALALQSELVKQDPSSARRRWILASVHINLGAVFLDQKQMALGGQHCQDAVDQLTQLIQEQPNHKSMRRSLALALTNLADYHREVGGNQEAQRNYERAENEYKTLMAEQPHDPAVVRYHALFQLQQGFFFRDSGHKEQAISLWLNACKELEELVESTPDNQGLLETLASTYQNIGFLKYSAGKYPDAQQWYEKELRLRKKMMTDSDSDALDQSRLAGAYQRIGDLRRDAKQFEQSLLDYQRAIDIYTKLTERESADPADRFQLGLTLCQAGFAFRHADKTDRAIRIWERAVDVLKPLHLEQPQHNDVMIWLADSYENAAFWLAETKQPERATKLYEEELQVRRALARSQPDDPGYILRMARAAARVGFFRRDHGEPQIALKLFQESLALRQNLARTDATTDENLNQAAYMHENIGFLQLVDQDLDKAFDSFTHELDLRRSLVLRNPNDVTFRRGFADRLHRIGIIQRDNQRPKHAVASLKEAERILLESRKQHANDDWTDQQILKVQQAMKDIQRRCTILLMERRGRTSVARASKIIRGALV